MPAPSPPLRRTVAERAAAWLVTGPLGHLWSVVADLATFALGAARRRIAGARHGPRR